MIYILISKGSIRHKKSISVYSHEKYNILKPGKRMKYEKSIANEKIHLE